MRATPDSPIINLDQTENENEQNKTAPSATVYSTRPFGKSRAGSRQVQGRVKRNNCAKERWSSKENCFASKTKAEYNT
ncbi:MAG: hypothetical protein GY845_39395 [Planctomycetes bacterium]|nr:hypothetical protein [Planctomycetota bacterium]